MSDQHLTKARAHFKNIVLTRRWNAEHAGCLLKKARTIPPIPTWKIWTSQGIILFLISRLDGRLPEAYGTIEKMSITDDLTQMFNRWRFHARLDEEIARARRYGHPVSLLMMDIDHYKTIKDR